MIYRQPSFSNQRSPEMRLVLAVFEDAMRAAARRPTDRNRRARRDHLEALAWVQDTDRGWPFAFPNVCDLLGLDADAVRQRVLRGHVSAAPDGRRQRRRRPLCLAVHEPIPDAQCRDGSPRSAPDSSREPAS